MLIVICYSECVAAYKESGRRDEDLFSGEERGANAQYKTEKLNISGGEINLREGTISLRSSR
jgi:hypothetical protein